MKKTVKETIKALKTITNQDSTIFVMWFEQDEFLTCDNEDDVTEQHWLDALDEVADAEETAEQIICGGIFEALEASVIACVTPQL